MMLAKAHPVANPTLGDDLAHPHDEDGASQHGHDHDRVHEPLGHASLREVNAKAGALEEEEITNSIEKRETNRDVARVLSDLALAALALAGERAKARNNGLKHLHDDLGRNVGHDAQAEHRNA